MRQASALLLACACAAASQARQDLAFGEGSVVFDRNGPVAESSKRALTGRFMHITDFHPDPHYKTGATFDSGCHERPKKKKGKKGKSKAANIDEDDSDDEFEEDPDNLELLRSGEDLARPWGSAVSDCDSPMALVNYTFDWLKKEWADEVDFVIWTGDNARHDIDRNLPRTPKEILELNTMMATRMRETFGSDVVIVPSLGNNDIYPHNVMSAGPTTLTESMLRTWKHFIPDDYDHVFERGAYYASEVIPDQLAVISLNTLYWYDSNTLVDGCVDGSSDPGALEFDWLEVQLDGFRDRGMQVWLTGHVPPHSGNYYDTCWLRYGDLSLRYQDTIVGHLYGHMNIDHFFFMDVPELESRETKLFANSFNENQTMSIKSTPQGPPLRHGDFNAASGRFRTTGRNGNAALVDTLRRDFGDMPGPNKLRLKDYAVMNVAPSIIPTYIPAVRIYSYNVSALSSLDKNSDFKRKHGHRHGGKKPKYKCKSPTDIDKPHCRFKTRPRYFNRTSPARRNGPLTPLGYAQFYLPEIDTATKDAPPEWKIEYSTFKLGNLLPRDNGTDEGQNGQKVPVPVKFLPGYDEEVLGLLIKERDERETEKGRERVQRQDRTEERTLTEEEYEDDLESLELDEQEEDWWLDDSGLRGDDGGEAESPSIEERTRAFKKSLQRITPWKMNDLTIPQYVKLARKLVAEKKMWKQFSNLMFVSAL